MITAAASAATRTRRPQHGLPPADQARAAEQAARDDRVQARCMRTPAAASA
ncbi:MAG: hypothetical protein MZW92_28245 [Comamonadaceae bacterium]|nr:hypothetical protein [Comamonadaceae bacterium]